MDMKIAAGSGYAVRNPQNPAIANERRALGVIGDGKPTKYAPVIPPSMGRKSGLPGFDAQSFAILDRLRSPHNLSRLAKRILQGAASGILESILKRLRASWPVLQSVKNLPDAADLTGSVCEPQLVVFDAENRGPKIEEWDLVWRTGMPAPTRQDVQEVVSGMSELVHLTHGFAGSNPLIQKYLPGLLPCIMNHVVAYNFSPVPQTPWLNAASSLTRFDGKVATMTYQGKDLPKDHEKAVYFNEIHKALQVIGHEFGHALTALIFAMGGNHFSHAFFPGLINESGGDAMGMLVKQFVQGGKFIGFSEGGRKFAELEDYDIGNDWLRLPDGSPVPLRNTLQPETVEQRAQDHPFDIKSQPRVFAEALASVGNNLDACDKFNQDDAGVHWLCGVPNTWLSAMTEFDGGDAQLAAHARYGAYVYASLTGTTTPGPKDWVLFEGASLLFCRGMMWAKNDEGAFQVSLPDAAKGAFEHYLAAVRATQIPFEKAEDPMTLEKAVRFAVGFDQQWQQARERSEKQT